MPKRKHNTLKIGANVKPKKKKLRIESAPTSKNVMLLKRTISHTDLSEELNSYFNERNLSTIVYNYLGKPFISTWRVKENNKNLELYLEEGKNDFMVDWGDGTCSHITAFNQAETKHTYLEPGDYVIHMNGLMSGFKYQYQKPITTGLIHDISQWGCITLSNQGNQFRSNEYLRISAIDAPDLTRITNLSGMFQGCKRLVNPDLSQWDTSKIQNMKQMFSGAVRFNGDLGAWNVDSVTDMSGMFYRAKAFNQDLIHWNTTAVQTMATMFSSAVRFNGKLPFNTESVLNMKAMFDGAFVFNRDIRSWNTSRVTNMSYMFNGACEFNWDLSRWDLRNVTDNKNMFAGNKHHNPKNAMIPFITY